MLSKLGPFLSALDIPGRSKKMTSPRIPSEGAEDFLQASILCAHHMRDKHLRNKPPLGNSCEINASEKIPCRIAHWVTFCGVTCLMVLVS